MVSTRTAVGSIGILANHAPLLAMLDPTELRLYKSRVRDRALRPGRGLPAGRRQPRADARRGGAHARRARRRASCSEQLQRGRATSSTQAEDGLGAAARRRARQAPLGGVPAIASLTAALRAASSAWRPAAGIARPAAPYPSRRGRRAGARRAADHLRHLARPRSSRAAAGFVKGWLESRDIEVRDARPQRAAGARGRGRRGRRRRARRVVLHGHLDVVPGRAEQFEPRVEGDRLIGRGAYDMKGGLAAMMCALQGRAPTQDARARALRVRARRGVRGGRRALDRRRSSRAGCAATSRSPASRPTCTSASQAKGVLAMRIEVRGRAAHGSTPWLGRQRRAQGDRRLPPHRVAAVRARVLRAVRPPVDQPRPDRGRRRAQQGARPMRRWTSTSATCPARTRARSSRRSARCRTSTVAAHVHARRRRIVVAHEPVRARAARRGRALDRAARR